MISQFNNIVAKMAFRNIRGATNKIIEPNISSTQSFCCRYVPFRNICEETGKPESKIDYEMIGQHNHNVANVAFICIRGVRSKSESTIDYK